MKQLLNTLYISRDDIYVSHNREAIEVLETTGENLIHIPFHEIESIVVFGNPRIDDAIYAKCAEKGIGIIFFSAIGKFKYRVVGETRGNVHVRKRQYFLSEDDARIKLANEIIAGKIINSMNTIDRFMRNHKEINLYNTHDNLQNILLCAKKCTDITSLRGIEGIAAKTYFSVFNEMILCDDKLMAFDVRSKKPPKNRCNALLSYTYTLLMYECVSAIEASSLDPYVGIIHSDRSGKPSLALDLMEEFRSAIADRFVLMLINNKVITEGMFVVFEDGMYLNNDGKRKFFTQWIEYKKRKIHVNELDGDIEIGLIPFYQAQKLAKYIKGEISNYTPFIRR